MVKDDTDSERGNPLPLHGLLFLINSKGFFYMHHLTDRIHLCYTSSGALDGTRNSSMGPPSRIALMIHHTICECSYHRATSRSTSCGALVGI